MPTLDIPESDIEYFLILFDENGRERPEKDGSSLSAVIVERLMDRTSPITDVFVCSHGWKGDVPAAIDQYNRWGGAMAACAGDIAAMTAQRSLFKPMVIGLHWPSLPWGMEAVAPSASGLLGTREDLQIGLLISDFGDSPEVHAALHRIVSYADAAHDFKLSIGIVEDFETLFGASGLRTGSAGGRPGADQDGFDPRAIVEWVASRATSNGAGSAVASEPAPLTGSAAPTYLLGIGNQIKDAILSPLRQLSFWKMKDRARQLGETGAHALLDAMQAASPDAHFHLMGHSFGCIVVSGMIAGAPGGSVAALRRPVETLFLVQGALSLWSYAANVPYAPGTTGYFERIIEAGLVRGPLLTTRSKFDTAIGTFYPLGAAAKDQLLLQAGDFPKYGGIGAFGIQGVGDTIGLRLGPVDALYDFSAGRIFNFEASDVIRIGDGASGAHSDIAHPEVAHAFWSAAISAGSAHATGVTLSVEDNFASTGKLILEVGQSEAAAAESPTEPVLSPDQGVWRGGGLLSIDNAGQADPAAAVPGKRATATDPDALASPGDATQPPAAAPGVPVAQAPVDIPQRFINADFEDLSLTDPISKGRWYTLAFGVDESQWPDAQAAVVLREKGLFAPQENEILLTVQLDTDDFETSGHTGQMRVPRVGKGYTKARFDVLARKDGPCELKATILKSGQFIQQMDLTFNVGDAGASSPEVTTRGRALDGISVLQPRDLSLQIYPASAGGYECVLCGAVATRVRLSINANLIDSYIKEARNSLMDVVQYRDATGTYVFQHGIDIEQDALINEALPKMAKAGALLMVTLFEGPGAGADVRAVGSVLRNLGTRKDIKLKIQIVAETLPVPWPLLYLADVGRTAKLDWDNFLGMRHIVEQIPLQNPMAVLEPRITSMPSLTVGLNFHSGIDQAMGVNVVAAQRAFWQNRAGTTIVERGTGAQLIEALSEPQTPDRILYLYCHALSKGLTEPGGPGESCLEFADGRISLNELRLDARTTIRLKGEPLVFINACESAEMSPTFYDGFAPYFMDKGARGVIGTECKMPAIFAKEWADRFFERFLSGETLGDVVLGLRREFLEKHHNPLGLLYAVYCDADTVVSPGLQPSTNSGSGRVMQTAIAGDTLGEASAT
ncbi:CHAT domain-containing protein [Trinickia symbiotica]|uniref:CHAT domain-containing protein n=1 Tax=Trinickia symbiotica TaxID=863227 RepID=UPI00131C240D|nr:CHAT domain-containing protein [Trinickia symbiotica]